MEQRGRHPITCTYLRVSERDGVDVYQVGHNPILQPGYVPYRYLKIKEIVLDIKDYTTAAFVYYVDGSMQYIENIISYYAAKQ